MGHGYTVCLTLISFPVFLPFEFSTHEAGGTGENPLCYQRRGGAHVQLVGKPVPFPKQNWLTQPNPVHGSGKDPDSLWASFLYNWEDGIT